MPENLAHFWPVRIEPFSDNGASLSPPGDLRSAGSPTQNGSEQFRLGKSDPFVSSFHLPGWVSLGSGGLIASALARRPLPHLSLLSCTSSLCLPPCPVPEITVSTETGQHLGPPGFSWSLTQISPYKISHRPIASTGVFLPGIRLPKVCLSRQPLLIFYLGLPGPVQTLLGRGFAGVFFVGPPSHFH